MFNNNRNINNILVKIYYSFMIGNRVIFLERLTNKYYIYYDL